MSLETERRFFSDVPNSEKGKKIIIIDGFGQPPQDPVTHEVATSLAAAFPNMEVVPPIPTAEVISDDTTLQLPFRTQAEIIESELEDNKETHIYAYSQGGIALARLLAGKAFSNISSLTFVGTPLMAEWEKERVERLNVSDMGETLWYVANQISPEMLVALDGVVRFQRRGSDPRYVGMTESYLRQFPSNETHFRNLSHAMLSYPSTLVSLGAEAVTDCTPSNAKMFTETIGVPFAKDFHDLNPDYPSQGVVIDGAPHRLGSEHRTKTVPGIFLLRSQLAQLALTTS